MAFKPGGVAFYCDGINTTEVHTSTCAHCQHHTDIPNRRQMMEYVEMCRACMRLICLGCAGKPCAPIMKKIEAMEEAYYRKTQLTKMLGF
jgi:hypothetical protein